ncbi:MAG: LLM class flavin-dependent oxidoreductase, partial [Chloroflexota bacterium]|nr:LLM class flavin-dependent oxidoreductase [Chloroflexota bacterium]
MILGVGVGNEPFSLNNFGEETDLKKRAEMTDEALAIITGLWSGRPFNYAGSYYNVKDTVFVPPPVQTPRIPIWVAATLPHNAPMRRAARWDGVLPSGGHADANVDPEAYRELVAYVRAQHMASLPFDFIHYGMTTGNDATQDADLLAPYIEAGMTWWLEDVRRGIDLDQWHSVESARERIRKGPPRI